ncbi:cupredoxin domain-containing protein [Dokdonella sp.]|uniref:cupredoxin domain-containing protein n=1 Tax=Dokdonella sp. TaxID=2291710 RepID=UPI003C3C40ED
MRRLVLVILALPVFAFAAELEGQIKLVVDGKPLRAEEATDAVVYFRPAEVPTTGFPVVEYTMSTKDKQFEPHILPILVGNTVRFPNEDTILHNAFSSSRGNTFDVGLYTEGEGKTVTFSKPGYVRVYCNVHHAMIGHLLVLDTPYFTRPDKNGHFKLEGLPEQAGDLVVWHDRSKPWHVKTTPGEAAAYEITLDLNLRRISPHKNKFGKPYGNKNAGY